jgi:two-component system chemotaxis response regulator CheB
MFLESGVVYVCPPQHHAVVNPDASLSLSTRGRLNRVRPNGDWLFESASASYRERLAAVVLSGGQNDGAAGVGHVRVRGGLVIAQEPANCRWPEMPQAAIDTGCVDVVACPEAIAELLGRWAARMDFIDLQTRWDSPFLHAA